MSKCHHRKKMCEDCAFRKNSVEMTNDTIKMDLLLKLETRTFYCHQTMYNEHPERGKFLGSYDQNRKPDGSPACKYDHQICAGFAALYTPRTDVDYSDIDIAGHAYEEVIKSDRGIS